jgi:hypothetical protein
MLAAPIKATRRSAHRSNTVTMKENKPYQTIPAKRDAKNIFIRAWVQFLSAYCNLRGRRNITEAAGYSPPLFS